MDNRLRIKSYQFVFQYIQMCFVLVMLQACPYKNYKENLLYEENFYQTIQFERNFAEEQNGNSFGFHFWILNQQYGNPTVSSSFKNPHIQSESDNGNLVLTIDEQEIEKFLIYQSHQNDNVDDGCFAKSFDDPTQAVNFQLDKVWQFILITLHPIKNLLIFQTNEYEQDAVLFKFKLANQVININLGGSKKIRGIYNLNFLKGRLTKLQTINYFPFNPDTYQNFKYFCLIPQKFIISFGVYLLNETSCQIGCEICSQESPEICFQVDTEFQGYSISSDSVFGPCLTSHVQVEFVIQKKKFYICVDWEIIYPNQQIIEVDKTSQLHCLFGYFDLEYQNNHFCSLCPYQTNEQIGCIDCLVQNNNWYMKPICKSDFILSNDLPNSYFKLLERSNENIDVFIIDYTYQLTHLAGVQEFCLNDKTQGCFLSKFQHLNQAIYVKCKQNYFQNDGVCEFQNENCKLLISKDQCILCNEGSYLFQGVCYQCQNNCKICINQSDETYNQNVICETCISSYTVVQGQCQSCGLFCLQCIEEYDKINQKYFSRCERCIDDSKYFFSFDGINCLENTIKNCQYAFQAMKDNISISTLDYQFQRQFNLEQIETLCSRCFDSYMFVFPLKQCLKSLNNECIFGYVVSVYDSQQIEESTDVLLSDRNHSISVSKIKCLIAEEQNSICHQIPNCLKCQYQPAKQQYICLKCASGFYAERFSQKCYSCNIQDCLICHQENKYLLDFWKIETFPFYFQLIEQIYEHSFTLFSQSQVPDDYEIFCDTCDVAFQLNNSRCVTTCEGDCLKCEFINQKIICLDCGPQSVLLNFGCTSCPVDCIVCNKRPEDQIYKYNPYLQKDFFDDFTLFSFYCFKTNKVESYYDYEINQFVQCEIYKSGCEKQLIISEKLGCPWKIESSTRSNFLSGENNRFYSTDYHKIKKIIVKLFSYQSMICPSTEENLFDQTLSQKIFTLRDVELEINCTHEVIWEIGNALPFHRFSKITINGLVFRFIQSNFEKTISFQSLNQQQIIFSNVQFYHQTNQVDYIQLQFFNTKLLKFVNTTFENFYIQQNDALILIEQTESNNLVSFQNISFNNFSLQDSFIIEIIGQYTDDLIIKNSTFSQGKVKNSSFLLKNGEKYGQVELVNFLLTDVIFQKCPRFMILSTFSSALIVALQITKINLIDSTLIELSKQTQIYNVVIKSCQLQSEAIILKNENSFQQEEQIFSIFGLNIQSNTYSEFSKFILIDHIISFNSELLMQNITIKNNSLDFKFQDKDLMDTNSSFLFFNIIKIEIREFLIERSYGLNEFTIQNAGQLKIQNGCIAQGEEYKLYGIHEYFECFSQTVQNNFYGITFFIYSSLNVEIKNLTITSVQTYDYPVIAFISNSLEVNKKKENLYFSLVTLEQSLFIQALIQTKSSFILVESNQLLEMIVENCTFDSNVLKVYSSDTIINSANIFNINAKYSKIVLQACIFFQNIVLNGKSGTVYFKSSSINIFNCSFQQNNVFIYEVIQPYLLWTFNKSKVIYLEQIQEIIQIKSLYGLGYIITEKINLTQNIFQACQGLTSFIYLAMLSEGNIFADHLNFFCNESYLDLKQNIGPAIYVDGFLSQNLIINIFNVEAYQIYSNQNGGLIFIKAGQESVKLKLSQIHLSDVCANSGSLIYFDSISSKDGQKVIKLQNINYIKSNKSEIIQNRLIHQIGLNNVLIYISKASIVSMSQLSFQNLFFQNAMILKDTNNIQLSQVLISEGIFNQRIIFIFPDQNYPAKIILDKFQIINIKFGEINTSNQKDNIQSVKIQFKCNLFSNKDAPLFLLQKNTSQNLSQTQAINFKDSILKNQYGIIFSQLSSLHLVKFNNFELKKIICQFCLQGLVTINFALINSDLTEQGLSNIIISNSSCGQNGCIYLFAQQDNTKNTIKTLLQTIQFLVVNYICEFNCAINGTCLYLENVRIIIQKSTFRYNNASGSGGTIYSKQTSLNNDLVIEDTVIENNFALIGGGIFMDGQQELNFEKLDTIVSGNRAQYYANDVSAIPTNLLIKVGNIQTDLFEVQTIKSNDTYKLQIQKFKKTILQNGLMTNFLLLPNGLPISQYRYFDWKHHTYIPLNLTLRIQALTGQGGGISNLKGSHCQIGSRIIQFSEEREIEVANENFISLPSVEFDQKTDTYNLDNISIYKREDPENREILELEFWCSSIFVPVYNKNYPFNLVSQHNQYYLRLQIQTYPCQMGEIRNETYQQCQTCKFEEGFYQLKVHQTNCLQRDSVSTIEVQPAMLNLRAGYWRPYFDTSQVEECHNLPSNCLGGWVEGDTSCIIGHIGALCEGKGQFSSQKQYQCLECQNTSNEYFYLALNFLWAFISLSISASGSFQSVNERVQQLRLQKIGFKIKFSQNSKALLIKMVINYLQILNSISAIQIDLAFPFQISLFTNQTALPNFLDCLLSQIETVEIQYLRIIWSLIIPLIYFCLFQWIYGIILYCKKINLNISLISTTLLYLYIYFSPILARDLIQMISFRLISGYQWISSNVAYRYDNQKHLHLMLQIGAPSLTLITVIIPSYLFKTLYKNRLKLDQKNVRQLLGYLYNEFKNSAYFWEVLKILQKITLNLFLIFYSEEILFKGGMQFLIIAFYQALSLEYQPYLTKQFNKLDDFASQICLYSIVLSLGTFTSNQKGLTNLSYFFKIVFIIFNLHFIIRLFYDIIIQYLKDYRKFYFAFHDNVCQILLRLLPQLQEIKILKNILKNYSQRQNKTENLLQKLKQYIKEQIKNKQLINTQIKKDFA